MKESADNSSRSEKVIHFAQGEKKDFLRWRRLNHDGFVLNERQASAFMFHRAFCDALGDHTDEALAKPKHCSTKTNRSALVAFARDSSAQVTSCQTCGPGSI